METRRMKWLLAVVSIALLLISAQADALLWKAFSGLCLEGAVKAGGTQQGFLEVDITTTTVECACINEQTGKVDGKPGEGNLGQIGQAVLPAEKAPEGSRYHGLLLVEGCVDGVLTRFAELDTHYCDVDEQGNLIECPFHECSGEEGQEEDCQDHVCNASQPNKIELQSSCLFRAFTARWSLYDLEGNRVVYGIDTCEWNGDRLKDGYPNTGSLNCADCDLLNNPEGCPAECTWDCESTETRIKGGKGKGKNN